MLDNVDHHYGEHQGAIWTSHCQRANNPPCAGNMHQPAINQQLVHVLSKQNTFDSVIAYPRWPSIARWHFEEAMLQLFWLSLKPLTGKVRTYFWKSPLRIDYCVQRCKLW